MAMTFTWAGMKPVWPGHMPPAYISGSLYPHGRHRGASLFGCNFTPVQGKEIVRNPNLVPGVELGHERRYCGFAIVTLSNSEIDLAP